MGCVHCGSQPGEHPDWCRGNIPTVFERLLMERDAYRNRLELSQDPSTKERILANIAGIEGQKARVREEYNARASMVETRARFLGEDLPRRLE